jgi:hypothetical protein
MGERSLGEYPMPSSLYRSPPSCSPVGFPMPSLPRSEPIADGAALDLFFLIFSSVL